MSDIAAGFGIGGSTEEDDLANDALYQEFLAREQGEETTEDEPSSDGGEGEQTGSAAPEPEGDTSAPVTTDAPATGDNADDAEGAGGAEEPGGDPGSTTPPETPADETEAFTPVTYGDKTYEEADFARMAELDQWAATLTPEATQVINAVLSGTHVAVPVETAQRFAQLEQGQQAPPVQQGQAQQDGRTPPADPNDPLAGVDLDSIDPDVAQAIRAQQAQMADLRAQQQTIQQQTMAQQQQAIQEQQQQIMANIDAGEAEWMQERGYTPEGTRAFMEKVANLQILPNLLVEHRGDAKAATKAALEMVAFQDPAFRQYAMEQEVAKPTPAQLEAQAKQTKLASLSGGGGSAPRPTTGDDAKNPDGSAKTRTQLMADEIRRQTEGSGQE